MMMISIVMPVYNGERFIAQAVESILVQTYPHWELIVVDDGSTDGTAGIVARFDDPRICYTYQENRGQPAALNRGLEMAQGECVTTLDADDWLGPDSFSDRCTHLESHPECGSVYSDGYYCDAQGNPLLKFSENRISNPVGDVYESIIVTPFFATGSPVMIRRDLLEQHRIRYDESIVWCQDWDFYIRVSEYGHFGYVDSPAVFYRLHDTNMTSTMPEGRRLQSLIRTSRKVLDSPRFTTVSLPQKQAFFYRLLVHDLAGRVEDQEEILHSAQFLSLPKRQRAKLLRWLATSYLLREDQPGCVRRWLRLAWLSAPFDIRTALTAGLSLVSFDLAVATTRSWRAKHETETLSPFELAKGVQPRRASTP